MEGVDWNYYDKYKNLESKYFVPTCNDFRNKADQAYCCICRLVYKWYNDGDVYDNTGHLHGWFNDISSFANWLYTELNIPELNQVLNMIHSIRTEEEYENLLKDAFEIIVPKLSELEILPVEGNVLDCEGPFEFRDEESEDEEYW